jgi:LysM repeat protein
MNLPFLIKSIYGTIAFTGLYSFEFVSKNGNKIIEIFFMLPPSNKTVEEPTRSSTIPTLASNYNLDAGNATKPMTLSGNLWFPFVGSPDNPVATFPENLENTIDGLNEFFKLRWMLVRYRDYVMTKNSKITIPASLLNVSSEINVLFSEVNKRLSSKVGALYDEIKLIIHDYDFDDHYYCRVDRFTSSQDAQDHLSVNYTINLELYERAELTTSIKVNNFKRPLNEEIEFINNNLTDIKYSEKFDNIQDEISANSELYEAATSVNQDIENINSQNIEIQSGKTTPFIELPAILSRIIDNAKIVLSSFLNNFIPFDDRADFDNGDITLDDFVSNDLLNFYNAQQKVIIFSEGMEGILNSIPRENEIRYYANADDYTLTTEQFDEEASQIIMNESTYTYYVIKQGDTLRNIAQQIYGDSEQYIKIIQSNNISENDIIDNNLVGTILKIPIEISSIARSQNNLVYEGVIDPNNINIFLHGRDLFLENKKMKISSTGGLETISGSENTIQNINARLNGDKGSLNAFNPDWGLISPDDGNAPFLVKLSRYLSDIQNQILSDPRIESTKLKLDTLKIDGEAVFIKAETNLIGIDTELEVEVG